MRAFVVPAFRIDGVYAEHLHLPVLQLMPHRLDHAPVFVFKEAPHGTRKDHHRHAAVPKKEQFHIPPEGRAVPFSMFPVHPISAVRMEPRVQNPPPRPPDRVHLYIRAVAQPGSALAWGARGRGFESRQPDQQYFFRCRRFWEPRQNRGSRFADVSGFLVTSAPKPKQSLREIFCR
jgi:hypothetical protein